MPVDQSQLAEKRAHIVERVMGMPTTSARITALEAVVNAMLLSEPDQNLMLVAEALKAIREEADAEMVRRNAGRVFQMPTVGSEDRAILDDTFKPEQPPE